MCWPGSHFTISLLLKRKPHTVVTLANPVLSRVVQVVTAPASISAGFLEPCVHAMEEHLYTSHARIFLETSCERRTTWSPESCVCVCVCVCVCYSIVFDSLCTHGLYPTRLLCPWESAGKNTGVGSHSLLQWIFQTQGLNLGLLHCRQILYRLCPAYISYGTMILNIPDRKSFLSKLLTV